ncbi:hypothetical protein GCM10010174_61480 [Kutzneria viridogrisea]|uniref:Uncharacterized protein n=1 Tax=Kutzneria viridogrisea TaxID=47990 RepID=A0ABR6BGE2_9PSEU|nr:hypothetical protein [Kutzneria viridogrisea]
MAAIPYLPNFTGLRGWLVGDEARALCTEAAEAGVEYARAIAPVGTPPDDRHPGAYRDSIRVVQAGLGGRNRDRVQVDIVADVVYAAALEVQRGHHTLSLTADMLMGIEEAG